MKILIANYRYFHSGGPESYMFNVSRFLTEEGHRIIPFSIHYEKNLPTPYSRYFVNPLGRTNEVYFRQQKMTPKVFFRTLMRLFYARDVEIAVKRLVSEEKPDIAYILHYLRKLSPSLLVALKKAGIPTVVRLSDYGMICPEAHCLRNDEPCTLCTKGNLRPSIRNRCIQGGFTTSLLNAFASYYHRYMGFFNLIDLFVVTNPFMYDMMIQAGYSKDRLRLIPSFVDTHLFAPSEMPVKTYAVYVGRMEKIKGVHVFLDAVKILKTKRPDIKMKALIIGSGNEKYEAYLREKTKQDGLTDMVIFKSEIPHRKIAKILNTAVVSVIPSLCYENLPNTILESYASGTPVIASNHGSFIDSVKNGITGRLFTPGDPESLAKCLIDCYDPADKSAEMRKATRNEAEKLYSPKAHIRQLIRTFQSLINSKN